MKKVSTVALTLLQIVILSLIWFVAQYLVTTFHLPLPANLTGMLLLLALIMFRVVRVDWLRKGATWLLAEMLLFFVPAVVAVVNYQDIVQQDGLRILAVLIASTMVVIAVTAWVVDKVYRIELKLARRKSNQRNRLARVES
ncbi:CidA/LrgA family protein [Vibrio aestuarianus]|uniref:CidA/LrgA family protein n=1 Tax=Vibrio aestuarianus TaxID=28171 RepID=A0A9X4EVA9_9VIBR|nr:CidA/LrgA family protein [Vibrio aestuarianus]KOE80431.1 Holin-like protein CidA [Vibrio alginolyticus]MDE1214157.1 CidA/LrgA family protein [Vibrio aestuarianus]MDE1216318.1 CidA/LrgA family protein [Vibrio aestuarianus]MDE1221216.1 CidA/LrgA family protein [Vibrio aestuarianus]MDE1223922.1 CidA/LrgA family protein [Vibrio aestuarianus]